MNHILPLLFAIAPLAVCLVVRSEQTSSSNPSAGLPFAVSPETTIITSPLFPDGSPDYITALNEKYGKGVTPENNVFVPWLAVVGTNDDIMASSIRDRVLKLSGAASALVGQSAPRSYEEYLKAKKIPIESPDQPATDFAQARQALWSAEQFPDLAAYLHDQQDQLDAMVQISVRPRWWVPYVSTDGRSLIHVNLPALAGFRTASTALVARATLRAKNGDFDGFLRDVMAAKRLGQRIGQGGTSIERLVGVAIDAMSTNAIGAAVGTGSLSEAQCKSIGKALGEFPPLPSIVEPANELERWDQLDRIIQVAIGRRVVLDGLDPYMVAQYALYFAISRESVDWNAVLKSYNEEMDQLVATMKKPTIKALREGSAALEQSRASAQGAMKSPPDLALREAESKHAYTKRVSDAFNLMVNPTLFRAEELSRRAVMLRGILDLLLAAAEQKAKGGQWPDLPGLVPVRLKEMPRDLYPIESPGALKSNLTPRGLRIYSVGQNGKDDGGINDSAKDLDDIGVGPP